MRRRKDEEEGEEVAENDGKSLLTTYNGIEQIKKDRNERIVTFCMSPGHPQGGQTLKHIVLILDFCLMQSMTRHRHVTWAMYIHIYRVFFTVPKKVNLGLVRFT